MYAFMYFINCLLIYIESFIHVKNIWRNNTANISSGEHMKGSRAYIFTVAFTVVRKLRPQIWDIFKTVAVKVKLFEENQFYRFFSCFVLL